MIIEYHRPETLEQALALLSRKNPPTLPLGGGSYLSRHTSDWSCPMSPCAGPGRSGHSSSGVG